MSHQMLLPGLDLARVPAQGRNTCGLATYPDVDPKVLQNQAKEIGRAGELLVHSVLTRLGERCYPASEDTQFDLLLMRPEAALRVQVKTITNPRNGLYRVRMQKGYRCNPAGVRLYAPDDYDLAALVILPHDAVMFTAAKRDVHTIPCQRIAGLRARPYASLHQALHDLGIPSRAATVSSTTH